MKIKMLVLSIAVFMSTSAFAYDQIKCIKYMEGDQQSVMQMIKKDLNKAADTPSKRKTVDNLDVDTMIAAGYVMYCIKDSNIDIMQEVGAK